MRRAIVRGGGEVGTCLAELLVSKGYEVRRTVAHLSRFKPDEVYWLPSADVDPLSVLEEDGIGAVRLIEAARRLRHPPRILLVGAGDLEPRTVAGAAHLLAYWHGVNARRGYGLRVSTASLPGNRRAREVAGVLWRAQRSSSPEDAHA